VWRGPCSEVNLRAGRPRSAITPRFLALAGVVTAAIAVSATPAMALSSSHTVLLIPGPGPVPATGYNGQDGIMPRSTTVAGRPNESFGKFSFTSLGSSPITSATLSKYDTVALIQVNANALSASAKTALAQFVAKGGKLLIHDADETHLNDYTWLLPGSSSTLVGASCNDCGSTSGSSQILANSGLISSNPADPSYVNLTELGKYTDAIGDANLLTSLDSRWFTAAAGSNAKAEKGAQLAYATDGTGLIVYNGFDTDMIMPAATSPWRCVMVLKTYQCNAQTGHMSVDWLGQMWFNELNQAWGPSAGGLPTTTPVSSIGTPVSPGQAGLPSAKACVAKRSLFLRLKNLVRHQRGIVQIDVYVNGRHRLREKGHWRNVTLRRLPKKGAVTIKIVATTKRHYHLISKQRYHAC
jgi:hypothetical protein